MSRLISEDLSDVLAFTPEAFAALGANVKAGWMLEALAVGQDAEKQAVLSDNYTSPVATITLPHPE